MFQQFSSFRGDSESVCCSSCISYSSKSNSSFIQGEMQDLALKRTTCKSTRLQMGDFSSYGNDGWGTWFGRSQTTPLITAIIYIHQQASKVTNTQLTPPVPFGFLRAEEPYKGTGPRHKHLHTTRRNSTSSHELVYR